MTAQTPAGVLEGLAGEPERTAKAVAEAAAAERERCAQVAYKWWDGEPEDAEDLRTAIRAGGSGSV